MESDGDGFVWVGTDRGLAWFDGYQFLRPSTANGGILAGEIRRIARKGNGDIVIHAGGALWSGRSGKLRQLPLNGPVSLMAPLDEDDLYVTTAKGHFRIHEDRWTPIALRGASHRLFPGANGKPWLLTVGSGLVHWDGRGWPEKPELTLGTTYDVITDAGGILAASVRLPSNNAGLWELQLKGASPAKRLDRDMARLTALAANGEGVATFESGDVRIRIDGAWESLNNTFSAALLRRATSLFLRANGDVWVGTHGGINIFRAQSARLRAKTFAPGDGRNNIHEILRRRNGELWLATSDGVVIQDVKGEWRSMAAVGGMRLGVVTGLSEDDEGNVWVSSGSTFGGALRLSGSSWRHFLKKDGLSDWPVHRIKRDRAGNLWFLTNAALVRGHPEEAGAIEWDGRTFRLLGSSHGMPDTTVMAFSQAPDGAYWFGTRGGILRFAGGKWERFLAAAGVANSRIFDVSVAPDGAVWFCHQLNGGGVGRMVRHTDGSTETRYFTEVDGVPSNEVWAVYAEADGRVWAATANGVGVYRGGPWVSAGAGYGIDGIKTWALLFEDKDLWFGSLGQGIFRINRKERLDADPRLFFQPLVMTGDHWNASWRALARHGAIRASDILTRYRFDGGEWAPWSATREHSISSSNPGTHRIEVQAVGALGDVDATPAVSTFSIPYPFYLRPGFLFTVVALLAVAGFVAFQTIRSRLRYTRELEIAKHRAEESGRARSAFLAVMSHEIRTPMNGVLGMTTVMLDTPLDQRQRSYMDTIRNSAEALLSVINDVLDFSKIESGTFQITPAPFDLEEVCERVVTLLTARAGEKALLLAVDYPSSVPNIVIGDGGRVRQILLNLAGNAIKFTDSGSVRIAVTADPAADGSIRVRIRVEDTGIGIAADKIPLLFQEFSQVDTSAARRHGGTGLGLAISKKLAEHMGGAISVESIPGSGSAFTCELPFELGPLSEPRQVFSGDCLILHPNPLIRETLAAFSRDLGFKVEALPGIDPFPAEPFPIVLVAERWYNDAAARPTLEGAVILSIDGRESASTLSLIPLSRSRLREALAETADSKTLLAPRLPDSVFAGRVLIVEDNLTNQRVIRLLLEKLGCTVVVAGDGAQAVQLCQHQPFDLVFMDIQMPVMDGLEATRRVRELQVSNAKIPILALTANVMEEDRQRCLDAGMSGYLAKPIVRGELVAALRQHLPAGKPNSVQKV
jgi:signal transduction histidine kinase/CheY-like chemotaxis protein